MKLGIDFGITNTDIVLCEGNAKKFYSMPSEQINDEIFYKVTKLIGIDLIDISKIAVTGGKSSDLPNLYKNIFKKYATITQMVPNFPLPKPNELLDNPEKHKQEIQMFSSGLIQLTQNPKVDRLVAEYFREISEKVGYEILSKEEINKLMDQNMPQTPKKEEQLPPSINLNSYVDSDTESDDSDETDVAV